MTLLQTVILRSPGGNVFEAMQIGRDVRRLLLETEGNFLDFYLTGANTTDVRNMISAYLRGTSISCK